MPMPIEDIIKRLGGPEQAARLTGVSTEAVRKWRQARAIPPKHWTVVLRETGLSLSDLQPATESDRPEPPMTAPSPTIPA
ncbi:carph-isopro domain-containing protein, partial [Novacetimonas hansenii]